MTFPVPCLCCDKQSGRRTYSPSEANMFQKDLNVCVVAHQLAGVCIYLIYGTAIKEERIFVETIYFALANTDERDFFGRNTKIIKK